MKHADFAKIEVMSRSFLLFIFAMLLATASYSQPAPEIDAELQKAIAADDRTAIVGRLIALRAADTKAFHDRNYDYLLGKTAIRSGDRALAFGTLNAIGSASPMRPFALKVLAEVARSTGNLLLERLYLVELIEIGDLHSASARDRLARNHFESGNFAETIRILNSGSNTGARADRENGLLLAESQLKLGQLETGLAGLIQLLATTPNKEQPDDVALRVVKLVDHASGGIAGQSVPKLPATEHFARARIYQFNRDFAEARLHFEAAIAAAPNDPASAEALFQIGRGYAQQSNFVEASKWFERVTERFPSEPLAKDALLQTAAAYGRIVRQKEAINRYEQFIERYPDDPRLDRAYLNIIDILRDLGEDTDALRRCDLVRDKFRGKTPEAVAVFTKVRINFARENWSEALTQLDELSTLKELGGSSVPGGTTRDEIAFLRAFTLERLERFSEAGAAYLAIDDGRDSYYGGLANERLRQMNTDEKSLGVVAEVIGRAAASLDSPERERSARTILRISDNAALRQRATDVLVEALPPIDLGVNGSSKKAPAKRAADTKPPTTGDQLADRLARLGLFEEAAALIESGPSNNGDRELRHHILARGGRADIVISEVEPLWRQVPSDRPLETLEAGQLRLLYPAPYADAIVSSANAHRVDPRLMLAIMRQESRFRPDARSYAAARGLMQFISDTADTVAEKLAIRDFDQNELYYPPTNILFGAVYLEELFADFPTRTEAVVASYNGGEDNMQRWFNRARSNLPERYVPEIAYSQTKDYVQKVMASYRVYSFLYEEDLRPRSDAAKL